MVSVAEELWLEGRAEGRAKGRAEGEARGEIKMLKKNILQILTFRFKHVPSFIQDAINARCDRIALESLMETALAVQSLEEFAKEL